MQIVQYINLVKSDSLPGNYGSVYTTSGGYKIPLLPGDDFEADDVAGHGTHTAGSAAGATLKTPAETTGACGGTEVLGCVGGCVDADRSSWGDDVLTSLPSYSHFDVDIDRLCPMLDCDEETDPRCLSDDVAQTLTDHGGMARGAKLAIFDVFAGELGLTDFAGNWLWLPCMEAGCKIHSASLGADNNCLVDSLDIAYDEFMYEVSCRVRKIDPTPEKTNSPVEILHDLLRNGRICFVLETSDVSPLDGRVMSPLLRQ